MTNEQEAKLQAMNLTTREAEVVREIVHILTAEQREKHGEFADEEVINSAAGATLRYLESEGFLDAGCVDPVNTIR